jgi:hypothetical protein
MESNLEPVIILLGAHRWRRQPVAQIARESGLDPAILFYEHEVVPDEFLQTFQESHLFRQSALLKSTPKQIASTISRKFAEWFVLGLDDYVCELAADLSLYTAKRTMPRSAARETLHKHLLRTRWNTICLDYPKLYPVPFRLLRFSDTSFTTLIGTDDHHSFSESTSLIAKPDALDASIGINRVSSWSRISQAVERIGAELKPLAEQVIELGIEVTPAILVEHEIPRSKHLHPGAEFSAEFLSAKALEQSIVHHLIGITQKYINPETFVEVAHCFPSEMFPDDLKDTLREVTSQMLTDLGVEFCISHWEFIVTEDGRLALVEAQLRPAGDWIMNLIRRATGDDPYRVLFDSFRESRDFSVPVFLRQRFAAIFFPRPDRDIQGSFSIVCRGETKSLLGTSVFLDPELLNSSKWAGNAQWHSRYIAVIAEGATFDLAKRRCEEIISGLAIEYTTISGEKKQVSLVMPL